MPRPSTPALRLAVAVALLSGPATADDAWVRVRTPHFEVLSDAGEAPAREAARRLERLRVVFRELLPPRADAGPPIVLLVIERPALFWSLVPRERPGATDLAGFFQGGTERDYAVLRLSPASVRPFEAAEHEYAHLAQNGSLPAQPVWVAEGLADVLSDAVLDEREARLGAARSEYEPLLRSPSGMSVERLLTLGYDSPEYSGNAETEALYARSWALVRWVIHRRGLDGLRSFLEGVATGQEAAEAFAERIGPLAEAEATLLHVPPGPLFRVPVEDGADPLLETEVPPLPDVEQRLGDLLLHGGHTEAARRRFDRALQADPSHVATRASLAGLLVREGEWEEARRHLQAALAARPDDPAALLRLARLRLAEATETGVELSPAAEAELVAGLETALSRAPSLYQAALLLAQLRPDPAAERAALLRPLFDQRPDRTEIAQVLSVLYLKEGRLVDARRVLEEALDAAPDETRRYLAARRLARLEIFSVVTAEVRGDLVRLDCRSDGSLLLTVVADPRTLKLEAESTTSFMVHGEPGTEAELLCGYQDRPVVVRYAPGTSPDPDAAGTVLWLAFDEP